ncbi:hypothetical protein BC826DRAFT_976819 [Russula brevipes]|nr:hypothetical protein BC826DRAFT_976819 [Russula brevipes]
MPKGIAPPSPVRSGMTPGVHSVVRKSPRIGAMRRTVREEVFGVQNRTDEGYSGADLAAVAHEAGVCVLQRALSTLEEMDEGLVAKRGGIGGKGRQVCLRAAIQLICKKKDSLEGELLVTKVDH